MRTLQVPSKFERADAGADAGTVAARMPSAASAGATARVAGKRVMAASKSLLTGLTRAFVSQLLCAVQKTFMWAYYAQTHLFVSSRETEKGSLFRACVVNAGCHPYVHRRSKAPESFNFAKLVALPALTSGKFPSSRKKA